MNIKDRKLENSRIELEIEVPSDRIESEFKLVFDKIRQTVTIDGFRKGKAPVQMIEKKYMQYATDEVAENIMRNAVSDAIRERALIPVAAPVFEHDGVRRGNSFIFKAQIDLYPSIHLGNYKEIPVDEKACNVTEGDIDREIETIRERFKQSSPKPEGSVVETGDTVKLQFKKAEGDDSFKPYTITVGEGSDALELEFKITGMKAGEEKEVITSYPKEHPVEDLAGKDVKYIVKIEEINSRQLPELNDDFARQAQFETLEDMRKKASEVINHFVTNKTRGEAKADIIGKIIENSTFEIPESMIGLEMEDAFKKTKERMAMRMGVNPDDIQHYTMEDLAAIMGFDPEEYRLMIRNEAERTIKTTLVLSEVIKQENLKVSDEKYAQVLEQYAGEMGKTVEEFQELVGGSDFRNKIEKDLIMEVAIDFIYENAKINKLAPVTVDELLGKQ